MWMFKAKFSPGALVATKSAILAFHNSGDRIMPYLLRHCTGDWGELDDHDKAINEDALRRGLRLLSTYTLSNGEKVRFVTDPSRLETSILTLDEY